MRAKKPSQGIEIKTTALRLISGSDDEDFTRILVTQVATSLWVEHSDSEQRDRQFNAAITAMKGMKPGDELEGMLSAQLIAIHNAAMECCRRAMLGNQTFEGRRESLNQANKLSRTYAGHHRGFAGDFPRNPQSWNLVRASGAVLLDMQTQDGVVREIVSRLENGSGDRIADLHPLARWTRPQRRRGITRFGSSRIAERL